MPSNLFAKLDHDPFDPDALLILAKGVELVYTHDRGQIEVGLNSLSPGDGFAEEVRWGPSPEDSWWVWRAEPDIFIFNSGTESLGTLIEQIIQSDQVDRIPPPGKLARFTAARVVIFGPLLRAKVESILSRFPGLYRNIVFAGHSLGGADGIGMQVFLGNNPLPIKTLLVTFGAPRVVDPVTANTLTIRHIRVHNERDPVPQVPPPVHVLPTLIFGFSRFGVYRYGHGGVAALLRDTGEIQANPEDPTFDEGEILGLLANPFLFDAAELAAHNISTYVSRLSMTPPRPVSLPSLSPPGVINMPIQVQVEMFCKNDKSESPGWSEGFYLDNVIPDVPNVTEISAALRRAVALAYLRAACMAGDPSAPSRINEVRVSDLAIGGDSLVRTNVQEKPRFDGPLGQASLPSYVNLLCRVESGSLYRRQYFVGGIGENLLRNALLADPLPAGFQTAFDLWRAGMRAATLYPGSGTPSFRVSEKNPGIAVTNIANAAGVLTITTATAHGFTVGTRVKITGVVWNSSGVPIAGFSDKAPRGTFFVAATPIPTPNTFTLVARVPKIGLFTGSWISGGVVSKNPIILTPITEIIPEELRSRRRGRLFGQPAGRRRARKLV